MYSGTWDHLLKGNDAVSFTGDAGHMGWVGIAEVGVGGAAPQAGTMVVHLAEFGATPRTGLVACGSSS